MAMISEAGSGVRRPSGQEWEDPTMESVIFQMEVDEAFQELAFTYDQLADAQYQDDIEFWEGQQAAARSQLAHLGLPL